MLHKTSTNRPSFPANCISLSTDDLLPPFPRIRSNALKWSKNSTNFAYFGSLNTYRDELSVSRGEPLISAAIAYTVPGETPVSFGGKKGPRWQNAQEENNYGKRPDFRLPQVPPLPVLLPRFPPRCGNSSDFRTPQIPLNTAEGVSRTNSAEFGRLPRFPRHRGQRGQIEAGNRFPRETNRLQGDEDTTKRSVKRPAEATGRARKRPRQNPSGVREFHRWDDHDQNTTDLCR